MKIIEVTDDSPYLGQIEKLFIELYEYMSGKGLLLGLIENGEKMWIESIRKVLGRFGILTVALSDDEVIGFAYGNFRATPNYLGNNRIGYIQYVYVKPSDRNKGIGKKLAYSVMDWFKKKQVDSYELQVLSGNESGIGFWKSCGFQSELLQMRKAGK